MFLSGYKFETPDYDQLVLAAQAKNTNCQVTLKVAKDRSQRASDLLGQKVLTTLTLDSKEFNQARMMAKSRDFDLNVVVKVSDNSGQPSEVKITLYPPKCDRRLGPKTLTLKVYPSKEVYSINLLIESCSMLYGLGAGGPQAANYVKCYLAMAKAVADQLESRDFRQSICNGVTHIVKDYDISGLTGLTKAADEDLKALLSQKQDYQFKAFVNQFNSEPEVTLDFGLMTPIAGVDRKIKCRELHHAQLITVKKVGSKKFQYVKATENQRFTKDKAKTVALKDNNWFLNLKQLRALFDDFAQTRKDADLN